MLLYLPAEPPKRISKRAKRRPETAKPGAGSTFAPVAGQSRRWQPNPGYVLGDAVEDGVVGLENNAVYARHLLWAG